jgi:hypothetical protein
MTVGFPTRRRALQERLPVLTAMPLTPIGDIGVAALSDNTVQDLTWETAADWDSGVSESGVMHATYPGGDTDAAQLQVGYSASDEGGTSLKAFWPADEDSGSTANDVSGNGYDGTINANPGVTGVFGSTAMDTSTDSVSLPDTAIITGENPRTASIWYKSSDDSTNGGLFHFGQTGSDGYDFSLRSNASVTDGWRIQYWGSQDIDFTQSGSFDGNWHHFIHVYDSGGNTRIYYDGTEIVNQSTGSLNTQVNSAFMGEWNNNNDVFPGTVDALRWYSRGLSASEAKALYRKGRGNTHTTGTKSTDSPIQPDLVNLDYTLNGESCQLTVIGSPGTASEETVTQSLDGSTSYTLLWSNSHTDFRIKTRMTPSLATATPVMRSMTLSG